MKLVYPNFWQSYMVLSIDVRYANAKTERNGAYSLFPISVMNGGKAWHNLQQLHCTLSSVTRNDCWYCFALSYLTYCC